MNQSMVELDRERVTVCRGRINNYRLNYHERDRGNATYLKNIVFISIRSQGDFALSEDELSK